MARGNRRQPRSFGYEHNQTQQRHEEASKGADPVHSRSRRTKDKAARPLALGQIFDACASQWKGVATAGAGMEALMGELKVATAAQAMWGLGPALRCGAARCHRACWAALAQARAHPVHRLAGGKDAKMAGCSASNHDV